LLIDVVVVWESGIPVEQATAGVRVSHELAFAEKVGGDVDDDDVLRAGRDGGGRRQVDVLYARVYGDRAYAREQGVRRVVAQLDRSVSTALEVEVEPGDVVERRGKRLAVRGGLDLNVGDVLLLVRNAEGAWSRPGCR
jgi:hypothetical protein